MRNTIRPGFVTTIGGLAVVTALSVTAAPASASPSRRAVQRLAARHTGPVAAMMVPTKRGVALGRARVWLTAVRGGPVPYSQSRYLDGWRTDCSGYVSMAWNLRTPQGRPFSYNTDMMLRGGGGGHPVVHPIRWDDLRPADAIGFLGAGSAGDAGHVMLFEKWVNPAHTAYWVYEQSGDGGTRHRTHPIGYRHFTPYRYNKILEG